MGEIFKVEIEYAVHKHSALVSVCGLSNEPIFHVQFLDNFSKETFQTEHLRYMGTDGYQYCDLYEDDFAAVVIDKIASAIELKLHGQTTIIKRIFSGSRN